MAIQPIKNQERTNNKDLGSPSANHSGWNQVSWRLWGSAHGYGINLPPGKKTSAFIWKKAYSITPKKNHSPKLAIFPFGQSSNKKINHLAAAIDIINGAWFFELRFWLDGSWIRFWPVEKYLAPLVLMIIIAYPYAIWCHESRLQNPPVIDDFPSY